MCLLEYVQYHRPTGFFVIQCRRVYIIIQLFECDFNRVLFLIHLPSTSAPDEEYWSAIHIAW